MTSSQRQELLPSGKQQQQHAFPTLSTTSLPPSTTLRRVLPGGLLSRPPLTLTYCPVRLQTHRTPPPHTDVLYSLPASLPWSQAECLTSERGALPTDYLTVTQYAKRLSRLYIILPRASTSWNFVSPERTATRHYNSWLLNYFFFFFSFSSFPF